MPQVGKAAYSEKQKRQAHDIEKGYEKHGAAKKGWETRRKNGHA